MRILQTIFILLLLVVPGVLNAQIPESYFKQAAENNPGLKAKYAAFEAAMQRVAQVNALPDPTLSFGYFISPVETRVGAQRARFSLTQMFPWFGTLAAQESYASLAAEAKYQEFLNAKNELYYKVKAAWYPLYEITRMVHLQKENKEILASYKQLSTIAYKNGKGSMVDVIRVDIAIENLDTDIKLLEDKNKPFLIRFNRLLSRPDTAQIEIADSLPVFKIVEGYRRDSLLTKNPTLTAFDLQLQSAQAQEELAYRQGLPKFGVGIDYVVVSERKDMSITDNGKDAIMPMVSMSLPIFRRKYKAAKKEAQLTQTVITSSKKEFENRLVSAYEMAWYELSKATQLIELYTAQTQKTKQVITLLLSAYSNTGKDFVEILRMQQELLKYQMAEATAKKEFYTALAELDYLTAKKE